MSSKEIMGSEEALQSGELHQIQFPLREAPVIAASDISHDQLLEIVSGGSAVIHPEFKEIVSRTSAHEVTPDKTIIERRSAHHVGFGRFIGLKTSGATGTVLTVAMKPFKGPDKAVTEFQGYDLLKRIGIETYQPVGIFPSRETGAPILVTQKRNSLISLDRDEWVPGRKVTSAETAEIAERNSRTVGEISELLGWVHAHGIFLPDGQIKNFAVTETGRVGAIDVESLKTRPLTHHDTVQLALEDIEKLTKSLIVEGSEGKIFGVGMLAGMTDMTLRASCEELIIVPYIDSLALTAELPGFSEQANMLAMGVADSFYSTADWPRSLVRDSRTDYAHSTAG